MIFWAIFGMIYGIACVMFFFWTGVLWKNEDYRMRYEFNKRATIRNLWDEYRWDFVWRLMIFIVCAVFLVINLAFSVIF